MANIEVKVANCQPNIVPHTLIYKEGHKKLSLAVDDDLIGFEALGRQKRSQN